jgi:SNARE domain
MPRVARARAYCSDRGWLLGCVPQVSQAEALIEERDEEIRKVVETIAELAQIMRDLSTLVVEQGTMLDRIDHNITETAMKVRVCVWGGVRSCMRASQRRAVARTCAVRHKEWNAAESQSTPLQLPGVLLCAPSSVNRASDAAARTALFLAQGTQNSAVCASEPPLMDAAAAAARVWCAQVDQGVQELVKAEKTQKSGRAMLCIVALIVMIVLMLIIVIIRHA